MLGECLRIGNGDHFHILLQSSFTTICHVSFDAADKASLNKQSIKHSEIFYPQLSFLQKIALLVCDGYFRIRGGGGALTAVLIAM